MSWLWIYITLMEWVGIVLVVKALGDEQYHIEPKKAGVYFLGNYVILCSFYVFWAASDMFCDWICFIICIHLLVLS